MSEQDKDIKENKCAKNIINIDEQQSQKSCSHDVGISKNDSSSEKIEQIFKENFDKKVNNVSADQKLSMKSTDEIVQNHTKSHISSYDVNKKNNECISSTEEEGEETPTLSGWLAYGFSSIVKSAKDTVNKQSGTLESIKRDLVELKATVQSTSASSVLNSTASMVKNTLNEIGATVNEISSLGTNIPDDEKELTNVSSVKEQASDKRDSLKMADLSTESPSISSEEHSLFNFKTLNSFAHKFGESARSTLTAVKDVVVDSLALKGEHNIDELEEDAFVFHKGIMLPLLELPLLLKQLQIDGRTFLKEPEGGPEAFEEWLTTFSLIDHEKQMEHLIKSVPELASIYETLVPGQLTENDFWHRYFYKAHLLKEKLKLETIERFERVNEANKDAINSKDRGDMVETSKPASVASSAESTAQLSRSSTDDWDKIDTLKTSDDEKDWVKYD